MIWHNHSGEYVYSSGSLSWIFISSYVSQIVLVQSFSPTVFSLIKLIDIFAILSFMGKLHSLSADECCIKIMCDQFNVKKLIL